MEFFPGRGKKLEMGTDFLRVWEFGNGEWEWEDSRLDFHTQGDVSDPGGEEREQNSNQAAIPKVWETPGDPKRLLRIPGCSSAASSPVHPSFPGQNPAGISLSSISPLGWPLELCFPAQDTTFQSLELGIPSHPVGNGKWPFLEALRKQRRWKSLGIMWEHSRIPTATTIPWNSGAAAPKSWSHRGPGWGPSIPPSLCHFPGARSIPQQS